MNLSVVLATFNEEGNIGECLESVKNITDDICVVDGSSTDRTVAIAKSFGAKVRVTDNPPIFHINKQKALEMAKHEWILQLDADERVSPELAQEIQKVTAMHDEEIAAYQESLPDRKLFLRHQELLAKRDGDPDLRQDDKEGFRTSRNDREKKYSAFFFPRLNYFLGKYLRYGGVYPDGVIRLVKKGKAHFPCKSVHEQIEVEGTVGWVQHPLYHKDSPTFRRYIMRNNRYVALIARELKEEKVGKDPFTMFDYLISKPVSWFFMTQIRHKGILDGVQGIIFSFFSALRFPRAYIQYLKGV